MSSGADMAEEFNGIHRALGRIEGTQKQILTELGTVRAKQDAHEADDDKRFAEVGRVINERFDELNGKLQTQASSVRVALGEQTERDNTRLSSIEKDANKLKGGGWVLLGLVGFIATILAGLAAVRIAEWFG